MRFGVSGDVVPTNMNAITDEFARGIAAMGFSGIFSRFRDNDPFTTTEAECARVRAILAAHGLTMYQCTGYWQCLIHPNETTRQAASRTLQAALRVAGWLGARGIDTGPGSMNPRSVWGPHPDNWTESARRQLIRSLKECAPVAEACGVILSLEGHQLVTLNTPEVMRDVLDAVGSPMVKCDWDPVNWITPETIYATGSAIAHMVAVLGPHIVSAHAKDVAIGDRLVLHLDELPAGQGMLDYPTFFRLIEGLNPTFPVIIEHCGIAEIPAVKAFLDDTARVLGITVY